MPRELAATGWRGLFRGVAAQASARAVVQALSLAALPVVSWHLPSELYGAGASYMAIARVIGVAAGGAFPLAVPIARTRSDVRALGTLATLLSLSIGLIAGLVLVAVLPSDVRTTERVGIAASIAIAAALESQCLLFTQVLLRKRFYGGLAAATVGQGIAQTSVLLALAIALPSPLTLLGAQIAGASATLFLLTRRLNRHEVVAVPSRRLVKRMLVLSRRFKRYPLLALPTALLNAAASNAPVLLIAATLGPAAAGLFAMGERIAIAPVTLLGTSIANVYVGELATTRRTAPNRIDSVFATFARIGALLSAALLLGIALLGPIVVETLLAADWHALALMTTPFAFIASSRLLATSVGRLFVVLEKQGLALGWNAAKLVSTGAAIIILGSDRASLAAVLWGYAIVAFLMDGVLFLLAWSTARNATRESGTK